MNNISTASLFETSLFWYVVDVWYRGSVLRKFESKRPFFGLQRLATATAVRNDANGRRSPNLIDTSTHVHNATITPSPKITPARNKTPSKTPYKCGGCGQIGHDRRNCPTFPSEKRQKNAAGALVNQNGVAEDPQTPPLAANLASESPNINWEQVPYDIFDLETRGRSRQHDEIIETHWGSILKTYGRRPLQAQGQDSPLYYRACNHYRCNGEQYSRIPGSLWCIPTIYAENSRWIFVVRQQ